MRDGCIAALSKEQLLLLQVQRIWHEREREGIKQAFNNAPRAVYRLRPALGYSCWWQLPVLLDGGGGVGASLHSPARAERRWADRARFCPPRRPPPTT